VEASRKGRSDGARGAHRTLPCIECPGESPGLALMSLIPIIPWSFSVVTALCFVLMARKAGRNCFQWATLGGAGSLVITTATLGAAEAAFIPTSREAYVIFCTKVLLVAFLLNVLPGWLITASMHRQHVALINVAKGLWAKVYHAPTSQEAPAGKPSCEWVHRKVHALPGRPASPNKMA
jgi:hypothetical protein